MLRSGSAGEVQGRDYWGSCWAGMCSENRWTQATKDPRICRTALDKGNLQHQCTSELIACSTIHPSTDQGFARSDAAKRQQPVEAEAGRVSSGSGELSAGVCHCRPRRRRGQ